MGRTKIVGAIQTQITLDPLTARSLRYIMSLMGSNQIDAIRYCVRKVADALSAPQIESQTYSVPHPEKTENKHG